MTPEYICPLCQETLSIFDRSLKCEHNHSFDIAKEHYVNLLPVQFKHSKDPGDNKSMVNARREFLEKGYYQPLVNLITDWYQEYGNVKGKLLDAGCGEGFYTHQHKTESNAVYGVDIAKEAIKKAGKKYQACHFSVQTLSKLAFSDQYFDWLYSVYAPILEGEFTRVLKSGGYLLTVTPAKQHLIELKEKIYDNALLHDEDKQPIKQLNLIREERLNYKMTLATGKDTLNLLSMTPFAFKASQQVKDELAKIDEFECQADFLIKLYQKPI